MDTHFWTSSTMLILFIGGSIIALLFTVLIVRLSKRSLQKAQQAHQDMVAAHPGYLFPEVTPAGGAGGALGCGMTLFILGLALVGGGVFLQQRFIREARLLEKEGVVTPAALLGREVHESEDSATTYSVTYAFTVKGNDLRYEVQREETVPWAVYFHAEDAETIDVIYARSDPYVARVQESYVPGKVQYWPILALGGGGVVCLLLVVFYAGGYIRARRLARHGVAATVTVVDTFEYAGGESTDYYVAYELPGLGPVRHQVDLGRFKRVKVGDTLTVVYLPENPKIFQPVWK